MPTQGYPYLELTDGTTTCTLANGLGTVPNYPLAREGWAPRIARQNRAELGDDYEDVDEDIPITIRDTSAAAVYSRLAALVRLLDQAGRFARGENVTPVLIQYAPQGSTIASTSAPYAALVLGVPADAQDLLRLSATWNGAGNVFEIRNVSVRLIRKGRWLLSATVNGSSASVANPGPYPVTGLADIKTVCPVKVSLANFTFGTHFDFSDTKPILISAQQSSDLQIAEAEAATATAYTSVADTTNVARGGSVLRYTPTGTAEALSGEIALGSITAAARRFIVFAALRNNSASVQFSVRVAALVQTRSATSTNVIISYTRPVNIDTAHTRPRFVPLGEFSTPQQLRSIQLAITASGTGGSPTFDIDYVVVLAVDNPYARTFKLDGMFNAGVYNHASPSDLVDDPRPLTALTPLVYRSFQTTSDVDINGYLSEARLVTNGTTFVLALMAKRADVPACWTYAPASGTAISLTLTINRYNGYLVPE